MTFNRRFVATISLSLVLSACGGGGGGGGGGNQQPAQALTLSTTTLNFASASNALTPAPLPLSGSVSGNPASIFAVVAFTNTGLDFISAPTVSGNSATVLVFPRNPTLLPPGTYRDTITVSACRDAACASHFAGSPQTVNVTYILGLDVSPASLSVTKVEGATLPAQQINLTYYAGNGNWTAVASAGASWLNVPPSGTTLPATFAATFADLAPGTYNATINITANGPASQVETRSIPVTYTVRPLLQVAAIQPFVVTNQQPAAGQTRSADVGSNDPARSPAWTASVDAGSPWLQLTTAAGTVGAASTLQMALVASEVAKLRNGTYTANITLDPADPTAQNLVVPVELSLDRTSIATVAPYVAAANRSAEVYLRGARLDAVTIEAVRFGTTDVTTFQLDNATRIRVTHPALAAGRYPVTAISNGVAIDSSAELVVQDASSYAAAGIGVVPIQFAALGAFDPERRTCYLAGPTPNGQGIPGQLVAMRAGATSWTSEISPVTFDGLVALTLSADGRELLVSDFNEIVHLDPVTLVETGRTTVSQETSFFVGSLASVDDGSVIFAREGNMWKYTPWTRAEPTQVTNNSQVSQVSANRTGNKMLWLPGSNVPIYNSIDSADGTAAFLFQGVSATTFASDRFGTRWAFMRQTSSDDTVLTDAQGTQIGTVPSFNGLATAMSEDGEKLVVALNDGGPVFRVFDVSDPSAPTSLGSVATHNDFLGSIFFTPQQDEVVSCGGIRVTGTAIP
jgi:hypothetical protein